MQKNAPQGGGVWVVRCQVWGLSPWPSADGQADVFISQRGRQRPSPGQLGCFQ